VHPIPAEDLEVELSRVQEEAQRNAIWLDRLLGVAAKLASAATVDAVTEVIVSEVFDAFGPDNGAVWLLDPTSTRLDLFRARGIPADLQQRFGSYPLITDNPLCEAVRSGLAVWTEHWEEYAARFPQSAAKVDDIPRPAELAFACLPLLSDGQTIGGLTMTFLRARDFPADERTFIGLLARDCARGIERARLYDQALTAVRVRDDFLSVAGHELRTPLAALVLQAEGLAWMSEGAPLPMVKERAHAVLKSVGRLIHLVDELLDTSRITSGRLPLQRETVELAGLVTEVVARLTTNGRRSSAPVRVQVDGAIEGRWDRARIEQVVTNLLTNALKYGRNAPIDVRVGQDARDALLSVQDYGIGIEPGDQARIFERFERAAAPQYGGLGLGLWITREIVSAHGGEIGVTSTPGEGATFTVTLPLARPEDP